MCGIYISNIPNNEGQVEKKLKFIQFRGPDNTGISKVDNLFLGHLRLSIIDLGHRSDQPMVNENLNIVYNGEIYNYLQLKEELKSEGFSFSTTSDTEVLLIGYKAWGKDLIPKLNGMFAFAIYDASTKDVFCARDRLGVKPLFYFWNDGKFEISSQLGPLADGKDISEAAISMYLDCGYIPSPFSIFENVHKLPPGKTMTLNLKTNKLTIETYWDLQKTEPIFISYEDAKKELHELLEDAIRIRLKSDVPIGSFLSGGIDSALVSSIASKISERPLKTFCIGFEDPSYDESTIAAEFAKLIGSNHTTIMCKAEDVLKLIPRFVEVYDEPFADSSALPSLLLNSVTKSYVTVALSGDGGDESFLGYNHFYSVAKYMNLSKIPKFLKNLILEILKTKSLKSKFSHLAKVLEIRNVHYFIEAIFIGYDSLQKKRNTNWLSTYRSYLNLSADPIQKAADFNIKLWLENDSNVKVDRASMAFAVEVRSPFLDYRIIEFARKLPVSFRYKKNRRKLILRDILKEYIPESVFDQPKKGFSIPIGYWIRNDLKSVFEENLSDSFLNQVPNLDILKFKKLFAEHNNGESDHSHLIWRLFVLSKWYQKFGFLDKTAVSKPKNYK